MEVILLIGLVVFLLSFGGLVTLGDAPAVKERKKYRDI